MFAVGSIPNAVLKTRNKCSVAGWVTRICTDLQMANHAQNVTTDCSTESVDIPIIFCLFIFGGFFLF